MRHRDNVIDFNSKIIVNADSYNLIYTPNIIKVTAGGVLQEELTNLYSHRKIQYYPLLELAINEQLRKKM